MGEYVAALQYLQLVEMREPQRKSLYLHLGLAAYGA